MSNPWRSVTSVVSAGLLLVGLAALGAACAPAPGGAEGTAAPGLVGEFEDDYGNRYVITRDRWLQRPDMAYDVVAWDTAAMTLIARSAAEEPDEPGAWSRIDWVELDGMPPWRWGFCFTVWDVASRADAESAAPADRASPRDGCNGFPFSRMRPLDPGLAELEDLGERYAEAWSGGDPDRFASFYAPDGTLTVNGAPSVGRDAVRATAAAFMAAYPDMRVTMDSIVPGDAADRATFHWHWTGTNTGPGGTGRAVDLHGYEEWTLDADGLIDMSDGHYDEAEYQRQLSAGAD